MVSINPEAHLRARIDAFVSDISTLVRRTPLDAVASALGSPAPTPAKRGPGRPPKAAAFAAPAPKRKRGKRTPEDVATMGEAVVAYVAKNPGQSVEQIKKALGVEKTDLQLPIIRLIEATTLKTTGKRRGTRYFVR